MTGPENDLAIAELYLKALAAQVYPESAQVTNPHTGAALRVIRTLIGSGAITSHGRKGVALAHTAARRLAAHQLRLAFDGDRYYITVPPGPEQLDLWAQRSWVQDASDVLVVLGVAENLGELVEVVDTVTGRHGGRGRST